MRDVRGTLVDGKYRIHRALGRGGMAEVFEAEHVVLGSSFALKFAHVDVAANPELRERFLNEARAAARIKSEFVARVTDLGTHGSRPYMVMELLTGEDLEQLAQRCRRLPVVEAVDYLIQALAGLQEVHAVGIVHRDLKPSNLFLHSASGKIPIVKLVDFGVSKSSFSAQSKITTAGSMLGSPAYMSPEQLRSARDVDARTDIWSCGVILYELLTGEMPFFGENVGAVFAAILETDVAPPSSRSNGLPPDLDAVILRCLQRNADERWPNALELATALAPYASDHGRTIALSMNGRPSLRSLPEIRYATPRPPAIVETISSVPPAAGSIPPRNLDSMATSSGRLRRRIFTIATVLALVSMLGGAAVWKWRTPAAPAISASPSQSVAVTILEPATASASATATATATATASASASASAKPKKRKEADPIFSRH